MNADEIVSDEEVKIIQLGQKAAFTVTGMSWAQSADPNVPDFEALQCVKDSVADINLNYLTKHENEMAAALAAKFGATLETRSHPEMEPQKKGCQVLIYHLDAMNNLHGTRIDLDFDDTRRPKVQVRVASLDSHLLAGASFAGECEPFTALRERADLESLRDDRRFRRFEDLKKPEQWRSLLPDEAGEIGRYLISACSQVEKRDGVQVPSIGPVSDCALLSSSRRFVWLPGGASGDES